MLEGAPLRKREAAERVGYGYPMAIIITMSKHGVAEAKNKITELIARAERGEAGRPGGEDEAPGKEK